MTVRLAAPGRSPGDLVLIRKTPHIVGSVTESGHRRYTPQAGGEELLLTPGAIERMERQGLITAKSALDILSTSQFEALGADWGAFSEREQISALQKQPYLEKLDELDAYARVKEKNIIAAIDAVFPLTAYPDAPRPSARTVRRWDAAWIASGRDIRALIDNHSGKGKSRGSRAQWILDLVDEHIDLYMQTEPRLSSDEVWRLVDAEVRVRRSVDPDLPLDTQILQHNLENNDDRVIGRNVVRKRLAVRGLYELLIGSDGPREARRKSQSVSEGPPGLWPLNEAEVDHTMLDVLVVDDDGNLIGRPFLTVIIDRYSRMILGFTIEMIAPSWTSVMVAIQMAVQPKDAFLKSFGILFEFPWPGYGVWDRLYMDRAAEFRSASMTASAQILGFKLIDLPRASGQLKGKVERWMRTNNQRVIHKMPGTTDPSIRKNYKPEKKARHTLDTVRQAVALFIVDHHNSSAHSATGEWPSKRYEKGMQDSEIRKFPPDPELLVPATAVAFTCDLTDKGIVYKTLRYESDEFRQMWRDAGGKTSVLGRISPLDPRTAMLLDPVSKKWVVGYLTGEYANTELTLRQLIDQKKSDEPAPDTPEENLKRARSTLLLHRITEAGQKRTKPTHQQIQNGHHSKKRAEYLQQQRYDADESLAPLIGHDPTASVVLNPYDSRGPYSKPPLVNPDGTVNGSATEVAPPHSLLLPAPSLTLAPPPHALPTAPPLIPAGKPPAAQSQPKNDVRLRDD